MDKINRRQFLQAIGAYLAALGLSNLDILNFSDSYGKVLAQSTPRKLALLVGINDYPSTSNFSGLKGCVTDVELQRQLLIHRFGFNPQDIITLTNSQATRSGIFQAFEEHLIKQAKSGDVVVFHYSGHGSRVTDPDKDHTDGLNSTLVPIDAKLPAGFPNSGGVVNDITGHTLFLLMSAIQSENLAVFLDSCYSGGGTRGNFRIRSRDGGSQLQISPAEKAYQEQWRSQLNLTPEEFIQQRRQGVAKGVVIASAQRNQTAIDAPFNGFYAGAFTYLLTQYLWQQTGTTESTIANITRDIKSLSQQVPLAETKPQSGLEKKPLYFISKQIPPAEAVITEVKGTQAKLWLGGLDRESLAAFDRDATFTIVDINGRSSGEVVLKARQGLNGEATLSKNASLGAFLQEAARAIPSDLKLRIGLDPSLGSDTNTAQQAMAAIKRIEAVSAQPGNVPYEGEVHYILTRMTLSDRQTFLSKGKPNEIPAESSIGLVSPGRNEIIPSSFGEPGETVMQAVSRLEAKLKSLLAVRIVKMILNANSSVLKLEVAMTPEGQNELIAQAFTARSSTQKTTLPLSQQLKLGTPFQFRVINQESRPLYLSILVVDPTGGLIVLFPNQWQASADSTRLTAGKTLLIPNPEQDEFQLVTQTRGLGEALIIGSVSPLKKALLTLQSLANELKQRSGPLVPSEPVEMVGDLLGDLSGERDAAIVAVRARVRATEIAALSISFEVV